MLSVLSLVTNVEQKLASKPVLENKVRTGLKIKEDLAAEEASYAKDRKPMEHRITTLEISLQDAKDKLFNLEEDHLAKVQELKQSAGYKTDAKIKQMTIELAGITRLIETLRAATDEGNNK